MLRSLELSEMKNKIIIQIIIQNFKITGGINYVISNFNRIKIIK